MSDDKSKKKVDANFVSCEEDYEKEYTVGAIQKEFGVSKEQAEKAFVYCCAKVKGNQPRKAFMQCAREYVGK